MHGEIADIGAGGVCLVTQEELQFKENDFVKLTGTFETGRIDLSSLICQIISFEKQVEKGGFNLHVSFLPYERDLKRKIIQLVYDNQQMGTKRRVRPKAT